MLCYLALNKENAPFQVNADGQHQGIGFQDIFAESRRLLTPVSYTHLDVYKRQALLSMTRPAEGEKIMQ